MSYQTKKQSIGYILKGALGTEIPANQLGDIALIATKIVPDAIDIDNHDTVKYARQIAEKLQFSEELEKEFRLEVFWTFDMKSVEEAEEFFEAFAVLVPKLNRK